MKKKKEFSKKIFNIVITIFIVVVLYSMALMWKTENTDALAYLLPAVGALAATATGFYYNKAKLENRIKLSKEYETSMEEIEDMENQIESEEQ